MKKIGLVIAVVFALILAFAGCGGNDTQDTPETSLSPKPSATPKVEVAPEDADIVIEGSEPAIAVVNELAQMYMAENAGVAISVTQTNSNKSIATCAGGNADIALSSRELKEAEIAIFPGLKAELLCTDGVVVIVADDSPIDNLTKEQVKGIFTGETTDWQDVGGESGLIRVYPRNIASEVRKFFETYFLGKDEKGEQITTGSDLGTVLKSADEMGAGVQSETLRIGYTTLGTIDNYNIKPLSIDGTDPSADTVASGEYPYVINLYLVTNGEVSDKAAAFIDYCKSDAAISYMKQSGYVVPGA
ncbi:MAG: substrate-binding domain-containing protein [Christensenellales bacterium]|jgi:phosphate transport system substrate-binding protein